MTDHYRSAGVNIAEGDAVVDWLQTSAASQPINHSAAGSVLAGIGGFAGLFRPNLSKLKDPVLVASTDGVGTKLLLGIEHNRLSGLGIDLVAMCVNDLYCVGARPLFFLDYYATGSLDQNQFKEVLTGIREGLKSCQTPLLGGETAELPGLYGPRHFDLAGFVIGIVDGEKTLGPNRVSEDDLLFALPSSGFHSNGYSLIRKWLKEEKKSIRYELIEKILTPTQVYHFIPQLLEDIGIETIHAFANITGGGISGNLIRVIPQNMRAEVNWNAIPTPSWMRDWILGHCSDLKEVENTFNLGAGMIAVVAKNNSDSFTAWFKKQGLPLPVCIGHMSKPEHQKSAEVIFK